MTWILPRAMYQMAPTSATVIVAALPTVRIVSPVTAMPTPPTPSLTARASVCLPLNRPRSDHDLYDEVLPTKPGRSSNRGTPLASTLMCGRTSATMWSAAGLAGYPPGRPFTHSSSLAIGPPLTLWRWEHSRNARSGQGKNRCGVGQRCRCPGLGRRSGFV